MVKEYTAKIKITPPKGDVTSKMPTFYNPVMVSNRNISITLLNNLKKQDLKIAMPLAGSGIRTIRFLMELEDSKIKSIHLNDLKEDFEKTITKNFKLSNLCNELIDKTTISTNDATLFLLNQTGLDYIDIDPFGSPNPFLAAAIASISRGGIIAITATDTAALTGTYPKVTKRKYWARNIRNYLMHETGLRILIRKVQLQGTQFDKALVPILSYHKDHYFRIYFKVTKGKIKTDEIINKHNYLLFCPKCLKYEVSAQNKKTCCKQPIDYLGPMWTGKLFDKNLTKKMAKNNQYKEDQKFLDLLASESNFDEVGFQDLHQIARVKSVRAKSVIKILNKEINSRTHFSLYGIKGKLK
jgi:tRNA (guanine26-N2/guanine27-N2)-dimethyltransferase